EQACKMVDRLTASSIRRSRDLQCLSSGYQHVLHTLDGSHVLGTLEGSRIGAAELAHAALHLVHGFIFVAFHPLPNALFSITRMPDSMQKQSRAQHCHTAATMSSLITSSGP